MVIFIAALMLLGGLAIGAWTLGQLPLFGTTMSAQSTSGQALPAPIKSQFSSSSSPQLISVSGAAHNEAARSPMVIEIDSTIPVAMRSWLTGISGGNENLHLAEVGDARGTMIINTDPAGGQLIYRQFFAAAARFDTINPTITWTQILHSWQQPNDANNGNANSVDADNGDEAAPNQADGEQPFAQVAILADTQVALTHLLGPAGPRVQIVNTMEELRQLARAETPTLILLPFDQLEPRLTVLAINEQNPVENEHGFDENLYPFVVNYYLHQRNQTAKTGFDLADLLKTIFSKPASNREADRLTLITMTGVTALTRLTAARMDQYGNDWPARVVGPELAAADITHVSNEVSFMPGCQTNIGSNNLAFCSKPEYIETLQVSGVDIIGLTGNHQNDFGLADAQTSLDMQTEAGFRLFGGGENIAAALAPLYMEHNGNRLAFLGANSFGPQYAWATESSPGAAPFDLNVLSATIQNIRAADKASVIFVDMQYEESYNISPMLSQREDFNAISLAGADVVSGVQAHSPQTMEFTDGRLILFGLGNLFFDQMWSEPTRQGLVAKHTVYRNRHISTQLLVTIIEDYGQPRWATPEERREILTPLFQASYWE